MKTTWGRRWRLLPAAALLTAAGSLAVPAAKVTFSETLRHERLTVGQQGLTPTVEKESSSRGKFEIDAELPLTGVDPARLEPATPFSIRLGGFSFSGKLGDDPEYRTGRSAARLTRKDPAGTGKSRVTVVTARLRWSRQRLTVRIEGRSPGAAPIAAADFVDQDAGPFEGETEALVEFAGATAQLVVPLRGRLNRQAGREGLVSAEAVTVEVRGEGRARAPQPPPPLAPAAPGAKPDQGAEDAGESRSGCSTGPL